MSEYILERLCFNNLNNLYTLYQSVYERERTSGYFELKYNTSYTGVEYIGYFAMVNNQPIAFYGLIPTNVSIENKVVLAAQSCDTMTHPEHRNKGLFLELAAHTFELALKNGVNFVFGFPNQHSYHGFVNHLGFKHADTLNLYKIQFQDSPIKKLIRKIIFRIKQKEKACFKNPLLDQGFDGIIYDKAYFDYKKFNRNFVIKAFKHFIWMNASNPIFLGTIFSEKEISIKEEINFISKKMKLPSLSFMISAETDLDRMLSKHYDKEKGFPVILKDLSGRHSLSNLKFQMADIDIF